MKVQEWSLARLILAAGPWLVLFPVLLLALLVSGGGNLGFTPATLLILLFLWIAPPWWLVALWRRGRRTAAR
jgi:hypothetical protein